MPEEQKENQFEKKEMTFPEFLTKSFECLFEQNRMLHLALKETLDKKFEKLEKRVEEAENNLKEGFLYYHRDTLQGLKEANEELYQFLLQPFMHPPAPDAVSEHVTESLPLDPVSALEMAND